jgi:hypothetical protein
MKQRTTEWTQTVSCERRPSLRTSVRFERDGASQSLPGTVPKKLIASRKAAEDSRTPRPGGTSCAPRLTGVSSSAVVPCRFRSSFVRSRVCAFATSLLLLLSAFTSFAVEPLINAHAHNDYEHKRPLFDALDQGFCSVEADIYLVDGKLLVAHNFTQVNPQRTLQSLYLEPLRRRIKQNGGRVYAGGPQVTLLIDLKTKWQTIYPVLRTVLKDYSDIITTFEGEVVHTNAILAVITGDRSKEMFGGETIRYAAYDGDLSDLDSNDSPNLVPWVSSDWKRSFGWQGKGPMPLGQSMRLRGMVQRAHQHGRRLRFWDAPDQPEFWRSMLDHKVDLINSDDLEGLQKFLNAERVPNKPG